MGGLLVAGSELRPEGRRALCLCGGGITGAMYEVGVLAALDDFFVDFDATRFDIYVGTSAGALVAWAVAAGISPKRLCRAVLDPNDEFLDNATRHDIFRVNPRQLVGILRDLLSMSVTHAVRAARGRFALAEWGADLKDVLPAGIFSLSHYETYLERLMAKHQLARRFEDIRPELYITANDLDSGHRAIFGQGMLKNVPIAKAICASSAIPVFFEPMRIGTRDYIDGNSGKTGHLDIALARGADLLLVVNPRVPIRNDPEREGLPSAIGAMHLRDKGMVAVWEQAERMSSKTKLHLGLRRYTVQYPRATILLLEPRESDADMFIENPMNFAARRRIVRYGYESAAAALEERRAEFEAALGRHAIAVNATPLAARAAELWG